MKKKEEKEKSLKELIIDHAVEEYNNGNINSSLDLENFIDGLLQPLMQKMLDTELSNHLEYSKYEHAKDKKDNNSRNGYCEEKKVETKYGSIKVKTPRDRNGTFNPIIIEKGQTKLTGFEDKCISLYAKGMSLRDIEKILRDLYGVNIGKDEITKLISVVNEETDKWRNRPLKPLYVFTYADCLYVPIKGELLTEKQAIYTIIGVDADGYKDVLGLWIDNTESASFWTSVFEDLKRRGVEDILFMSSDGIAGFKGSLEQVFEKTWSQRCVVHLTRNLAKITPRKELNKVIQGWKKIYTATSIEVAHVELEQFKKDFSKQKNIIKKVEEFMPLIEPLFELPIEIRKAIYTSNAVESVNSALRKVTNGKGAFPNETSVFKVLFLRIKELKEKWNKPIRNWEVIREQLIEMFQERYTKYIEI